MIDELKILTKAQVTFYRGLKQAKKRNHAGLFLLEGIRLCQEAFKSSLELDACIVRKNFNKLEIPRSLLTYEANQTQMEQVSDSKNPQGIICVGKIPVETALPKPNPEKPLLVLDHLADPGNMGTIFRSALWFGVSDILLGPNCVDPFSPKVVRSSMGAITSLRIHFSTDLRQSALDWKQETGKVGALHMAGTPLHTFSPEKGLFLIVGSEAHGVSQELLDCATPLSINKKGHGESLNAAMAASIALYELNRIA